MKKLTSLLTDQRLTDLRPPMEIYDADIKIISDLQMASSHCGVRPDTETSRVSYI